MKKMLAQFVIAVGVVGTSGCAASLSSQQKAELKSYETAGQAVKEKNPGTGAVLGLLPGGGSFYTRRYGLGALNLLTWPLSILWDPFNGYNGSQTINYYATVEQTGKTPPGVQTSQGGSR